MPEKYGIIHKNQRTDAPGDNATITVTTNAVAGANDGGAEAYLNKKKDLTAAQPSWGIDVEKAETPSQFTHKIFGGIGYIFEGHTYPLIIGLAGHYEFDSDDGMDNWGIWEKLGITF